MFHVRFKKIFLLVFILCLISTTAYASIPTWRILWIILPRVNAIHTDGVTYNFTLTQDEITKIREMSERSEQFIEEATGNAVDIEMTVVESKGTVRSLTDDGTYLCVAEDDFPSDVKRELEHAKEEDNPYQVKVATFRLDGESEKLHNWYGLGGGTYARVHFYTTTKSSDFEVTETAPHPEEVWIHELLHCFESIFGDLGTMAGLHDNAKYGYENHNGWYRWYHDVLAGQVEDPTTGEYIGIKSDMWQHLPFTLRTAYWKGHTYKILDTVKSWHGAKTYCESLDGHLVTITSEEEQNVVATLLKQAATWNYFGYWMGAQKDTQKAPKWHWVTGEAFKYAKFSEGQPDGYGDYLQMYNYPDQGNWDDTASYANVEIQGGYYPHGMICEWEYTETPPVTILTANHLPGGIVNTNYSFQLKAEKGTAAAALSTPTWSHISGKLPTGLTLTPTGLLTGITTATGSFDFTLKAELDAGSSATNTAYNLKTFTIEVTSNCVAPVITTVDLKDVNVGDEYHKTIEVKGSTATWSIVDKNLPAELVLSPNGEITGKPLTEGTYEFTVRAANSAGYNDKKFNLTVVDASFPETEMESDDEEEEEEQGDNDESENNQGGDSNDNRQDDVENNENNENQGQEQGQEQERQESNNETNNESGQPNSQQNRQEVNNPQEPNNNTHSNDSSGGGGCNSGMFNFLSCLCLMFICQKRRHWAKQACKKL